MRTDFDPDGRPYAASELCGLEANDRGVPRLSAAAWPARSRSWRRTTVRVAKRLSASAERVFAAWLDAGSAGRWLFATASAPIAQVQIDPRVGGAFRFIERRRGTSTRYAGRYLEIVPPRRLAFTLAVDEGPASMVTVDIAPRPSGCALVLVQRPVPVFERQHSEGRWSGILYGLELMLDAAAGDERVRTKHSTRS